MGTWKKRAATAMRGAGVTIVVLIAGALSVWVAAIGEVSYEYGTIVDVEYADGGHWIRIETDDAAAWRCRITADSASIVEVGDRVEIRTRRTLFGNLPSRICLCKLRAPAA